MSDTPIYDSVVRDLLDPDNIREAFKQTPAQRRRDVKKIRRTQGAILNGS